MALRDSSSDAGRKGMGARSQGKAVVSNMYTWPNPKGEWFPAYSGGTGKTDPDPDDGTPEGEVGC